MTRRITDEELQAETSRLLDGIYAKRVRAIQSVDLRNLLLTRNPYLYRATAPENAAHFIAELLVGQAWSSIETVFGNEFFEPLALWAAKTANDDDSSISVRASSSGGVDVEIESVGALRAIAVKSGTKIFNAQSRKRQSQEMSEMRSRLAKTKKFFDGIVGYAYGRKESRAGGSFRELAGQALWSELTGDEDFYVRIITAMAEPSRAHAEEFSGHFDATVNKLAGDFLSDYLDDDGAIDWPGLVRLNSSESKPPRT